MANIAEIMKQMPSAFNADAAGDLNATVNFDFTSDEKGIWSVTVADGACSVAEGAADAPTATIMMKGDDYVNMVKGELNAVTAFMTGKIKVDGDLSTVMKFQTLFD